MFRYGSRIAAAAFFLCSVLHAQFLPQSLDIEKQLPEGERATIARIENLSHLPPGVWHYHVGDLRARGGSFAR